MMNKYLAVLGQSQKSQICQLNKRQTPGVKLNQQRTAVAWLGGDVDRV